MNMNDENFNIDPELWRKRALERWDKAISNRQEDLKSAQERNNEMGARYITRDIKEMEELKRRCDEYYNLPSGTYVLVDETRFPHSRVFYGVIIRMIQNEYVVDSRSEGWNPCTWIQSIKQVIEKGDEPYYGRIEKWIEARLKINKYKEKIKGKLDEIRKIEKQIARMEKKIRELDK